MRVCANVNVKRRKVGALSGKKGQGSWCFDAVIRGLVSQTHNIAFLDGGIRRCTNIKFVALCTTLGYREFVTAGTWAEHECGR